MSFILSFSVKSFSESEYEWHTSVKNESLILTMSIPKSWKREACMSSNKEDDFIEWII